MKNRELFLESASKIKAMGFDVDVCNDNDHCYGYVTDGKNIGYFQQDAFPEQTRFSTVHKPCRDFGHGFSCQDTYNGVFEIAEQNVLESFKTLKFWNKKVVSVQKYADFNEFISDKWYSKSLTKL